MAVIGGVAGYASNSSSTACSKILFSQGPLGGQKHEICHLESAAFGASGGRPGSVLIYGNWLLAGDLRLDEDEDLSAKLGMSGRPSPSQTDLLLAAWSKWQINIFDHLIGDYAFALYDRTTDTVTLARDPTGQHPLFFKIHNRAIAIASLPSGLKNVFFPSGHNLTLLARNLESLSGNHGESYLEHIQKVEPGEIVQFRNGQVIRRYHWNPQVDQIPRGNCANYVSGYRDVLGAAVKSRLRYKKPIGSQLSSGLDSSAVTATAAMLLAEKTDLIAFTAAPLAELAGQLIRHRFADESCLAAETARRHGIRHVVIREVPPIFEVASQEAKLLQAPILDPFNLAWWTQIRREAGLLGVRILLTGELGNLTLNAGSLDMLRAYIQRGSFIRWLQEANKLSHQPNVRWRGIAMSSFGQWVPQHARHAIRRLFLGIPFPGRLSFVRREWVALARNQKHPVQSQNPYQAMLDTIRNTDLGLNRKASVAGYGIEELDPLSDRRILDFAFRVPPEELLRDGETRSLARRALTDRVPASVLNLKTRGLQSADWHLRVSKQAARDAFETISSNSDVQSLLDLNKIDQAIQNWPTTKQSSFENIVTYRDRLVAALSVGIYLSEAKTGLRSIIARS